MLDAIGDLLPAAAGIALSPFPIVGVALVLGASRGRANGLGFLLGWFIGLGTITGVIVVLASGAADASSETPRAIAWLRVLLGVVLLALAGKKLVSSRGNESEPERPGWMAGLGQATPWRAVLVGLLLGAANPKNIAFTLGAAPTIATIGLSNGRMALTALLYVVLASIIVVAMVAGRILAPGASASALHGIERLMVAHGQAITIVILALLGAKILGDGLAGI